MSQPHAARGYETSTSASRALRVATRQAFGLPWNSISSTRPVRAKPDAFRAAAAADFRLGAAPDRRRRSNSSSFTTSLSGRAANASPAVTLGVYSRCGSPTMPPTLMTC
jgi:hypothetical protein